jgi:anti-sigma B factor antagonist
VLRLRCLRCGLIVPYKGSRGDVCPRCLVRDDQAVALITISDQPSAPGGTIGRLRIHTKDEGTRQTIVLSGELDVASAQILESVLADACASGVQELVLDVGGIEFMDSTGLRAILQGQSLCAQHRCSYSLSPAQRQVERVFKTTGVDKRLRRRPRLSTRRAHS